MLELKTDVLQVDDLGVFHLSDAAELL
jgi:hypothetical protein